MDAAQLTSLLDGLLQNAQLQGVNVQELRINPELYSVFVDGVSDSSTAPDTRSWIDRALKIPHTKPVAATETFRGVRVVSDADMALNQVGMLNYDAKDQESIARVKKQIEESMRADKAIEGTVEEVAIEEKPSRGPSLDELSGNVNTPTSVMIGGMANLDRVKNVVILRFMKDGGIEILSTYDTYGCIGALNASLSHLARHM